MSQVELVVGPNGAGKSTFVELVLQPRALQLPFVNADVIAKARWPDSAEAHSYEAARIAAATRERLLESGRSFIAETVFSHPSKIDLIRSALDRDYDVNLHVVMVPVDLSVQRVAHRVIAGGHAVPEDKIRERHHRLWSLVAVAVESTTSATFYDNSRRTGPAIVAEFFQGMPIGAGHWPDWTPHELSELWRIRGGAEPR